MSEEYLQKQLTNYLNTIEELRAENERLKEQVELAKDAIQLVCDEEIRQLQAKLKKYEEAIADIENVNGCVNAYSHIHDIIKALRKYEQALASLEGEERK